MTCIMISAVSASPALIPVESVLLGLDAYSVFCLLHRGFHHRASGHGLHMISVYMMRLSLKVDSKYWAISLQLPSQMVFFSTFYLHSMLGFTFLYVKEVYVEFFSPELRMMVWRAGKWLSGEVLFFLFQVIL